jgi:hypothetical protein
MREPCPVHAEIRDLIDDVLSAQTADRPHEVEHYFVCGQCAQAVDARSLAQIFHHLAPDHRRLSEAELTELYPFQISRNESAIVLKVLGGVSQADVTPDA